VKAPAVRAGPIEELEQRPDATGRRATTSPSLQLAPAASRMEAPKCRIAYLDNLKIVLVAGVIVAHAANFYGAGTGWLGVNAMTAASYASAVTLGMGFAIGTMFAMGTFFFVAGGLTPGSLARKGAGRYLRGPLVRLGAPLVASILLIMPASWFLGVLGTTGNVGQAWKAAVGSLLILDPGVAWFLTELLIFSAAFVVYRRWRPRPARAHGSLGIRQVLTAIWLIAAVTFGVRLVWPMNSYQPLGLHLWLWPQCLTLFWLGALAAERGWVNDLPRRVKAMALVAAMTAGFLMIAGWIVSGASADFRPFFGGWRWQALGAAIIEGMFSVSLTLILVHWFRRHLNRQGRLAGAMSRDAYAAFILQAPVLVAGALLLRALPVSGEVKFVLLAAAGVAGTFAAVHVLRRSAPLIDRIV
jgi:hypothetical protein